MADIAEAEDSSFDVEALIAEFLADPTRDSLELPHMTTGQRRQARKLVENHPELKCESYGFGAERQLHLFKKGSSKDSETAPSPAVNVKNTFIDDWVASEDAPEPVVFRSLPLQAGKSPLQEALIKGSPKFDLTPISDSQSQTATGEQPSFGITSPEVSAAAPALLHVPVRNTFIHIEGDSVDERMVQTMPRDMFRQNIAHEASGSTASTAAVANEASPAAVDSTVPPPPSQPAPAVVAGLPVHPECPAVPSTAPVAPMADAWLTPGTQIQVEGLIRAPAFNGLSGVVQFYEEETGRYSVLLSSPSAPNGVQKAKIKGENLRLSRPPPYNALGSEAPEPCLLGTAPNGALSAGNPLRLTGLV